MRLALFEQAQQQEVSLAALSNFSISFSLRLAFAVKARHLDASLRTLLCV
jgi:hypothetical protein